MGGSGGGRWEYFDSQNCEPHPRKAHQVGISFLRSVSLKTILNHYPKY